ISSENRSSANVRPKRLDTSFATMIGGWSGKTLSKKNGPVVPGRCPMRCTVLVVELRRLLRRLEDFRVVPVEDRGVLRVADVADLCVRSVGIDRVRNAGNRRQKVLVEAFLEVHRVASQDDRTG